MSKLFNKDVKNEMARLRDELSPHAPEYNLDLSIKLRNDDLMYSITLFPHEIESVEDIYETFGVDDVDLRLNFFILLAELRKKQIDKLTKVEAKK